VNGICSCGLPTHCCQPAVAGCIIYADLRDELSTHLAPQTLFTQSSPVCEPLLQAFSGLHVCLQLTWEVGLPSSPVEFSSLRHSHKLSTPGCWARTPTPTGASPARLACLFTVPERILFPQSLALSVPHPLSSVFLLLLLLITQFLFFPWVEVGLSRGLCCSGPRLSVGVPRYR
jgi:hypothetical protein